MVEDVVIKGMPEIIVCEAVCDARCRSCQYRTKVYLRIPVTEHVFFEEQRALAYILDDRFSPGHMKKTADRLRCDRCDASDFEIAFITRLLAYRESDELETPVVRPV